MNAGHKPMSGPSDLKFGDPNDPAWQQLFQPIRRSRPMVKDCPQADTPTEIDGNPVKFIHPEPAVRQVKPDGDWPW